MIIFEIIAKFFDNLKSFGELTPAPLLVMLVFCFLSADVYVLAVRKEMLHEFGRTKQQIKTNHPVVYWMVTLVAIMFILLPALYILFFGELMEFSGAFYEWRRGF